MQVSLGRISGALSNDRVFHRVRLPVNIGRHLGEIAGNVRFDHADFPQATGVPA
jgi:hypothetical protein